MIRMRLQISGVKKQLSQWMARKTDSPSPGLETICVAFVALLAALSVGRGQMGLSSLSFSYAHQVLLFSHGHGWQTYLNWPPGYALLATPLHWLGLTPLRALWVISLLSFMIAAACVYRLACQGTDRRKARVATALFLLNPLMLQWANQVMTEMAFIAATLLAYDALGTVFFLQAEPTKKWRWVLAGIALALPFGLRIIGLLTAILGMATVALLLFLRREKRTNTILPLASAILLLFFLALRNLLFKNNLTGHGLTHLSRSDFPSALQGTLRLLLQEWLPVPAAFQSLLDHTTILALFFGLLLFFALINWKSYYTLLLTSYPVYYCLAFAYAYSHTRIDLLNERFVTPVIPFLSLALIFFWHESGKRLFVKPITKRGLSYLIYMLLLTILIKSALLGIKNQRDWDRRLSSQTIDYILHKLPKGVHCAGNRNQIQAFSLDYAFYQIPGIRPEDADYTVQRPEIWTRSSAIALWLEQDIRYILFFTGKTNSDLLLHTRGYGSYVDSLQTTMLPEMADKVVLNDGMVIKLQDAATLANCLDPSPAAEQ